MTIEAELAALVAATTDLVSAARTTGGLTDAQLRATPLPTTGGLTDAQLRATPVPTTGGLTDAQLRATPVPTTGGLTDAQLRATPVPTTGGLTDAELRAAPVPTADSLGGTRTYNFANNIRVAVGVASTAAAALPALSASREIMAHASTRCFVRFGASGLAAASAGAGQLVLEAGERFHFRLAATSTHYRVIRDTADGFLTITAVA